MTWPTCSQRVRAKRSGRDTVSASGVRARSHTPNPEPTSPALLHVKRGEPVSAPRYRYAHQQERKRWAPTVEQGRAYCAEPICLMPTRWIPPGTPWHLCHDPTGTVWIGVGHERCNATEAAKRMHRTRKAKRRWAL